MANHQRKKRRAPAPTPRQVIPLPVEPAGEAVSPVGDTAAGEGPQIHTAQGSVPAEIRPLKRLAMTAYLTLAEKHQREMGDLNLETLEAHDLDPSEGWRVDWQTGHAFRALPATST
jgi:hypothetical protein